MREEMLEEALLPCFGYFGSTSFDCLRMPVGFSVTAVRIRLRQQSAAPLNLKQLVFVASGKDISLGTDLVEFSQSSHYKDEPKLGGRGLLDGGNIHTKSELAPYWSVRMHKPVQVEELHLFNRVSAWGCRSRYLVVEVKRNDAAPWEEIVDLRAAVRFSAALDALVRSMPAGHALALAPQGGRGGLPELRESLLASLANRLRSGDGSLTGFQWPLVIQAVDFWWQAELSDDELTVLAGFLLAQKLQGSRMALSAFSRVFGTAASLDRLTDAINAVASAYGAGQYVVTRHGLNRAVLHEQRSAYLQSLRIVLDALKEEGIDACVAYGTLLGAVREGTFIPHDDDVDVIYLASGGSFDRVRDEVAELKARLLARGFSVSVVPKYLNLHIRPPGGRTIDIFPAWREGDQLRLYMQGMEIGTMDSAIVFPVASVELYGESLPAPGDPHTFLQERYGGSWRTPDKYYEWPWKLAA